jgi:hypothetical protein
MHWAHVRQFAGPHDAHVNQALAGMSAKLGLAMDRMGRIKI